MTGRSRISMWHGLPLILTTIFCALLFSVCAVPVCAQEASADSRSGAYDVPIPAWVAQVATDLKKEFLAGVATQAVELEDARAEGDLQLIVDAADRLVSDGDAINKAIDSIGRIDSSFGIPGVSRLITAEGAKRDTLFGFVIWHEMSAGPSWTIASNLETSVNALISLTRGVQRNARLLSSNAARVRSALESEDYASIANSSDVVSEATGEPRTPAGTASLTTPSTPFTTT